MQFLFQVKSAVPGRGRVGIFLYFCIFISISMSKFTFVMTFLLKNVIEKHVQSFLNNHMYHMLGLSKWTTVEISVH